jgi:hypothetical protein
MTNDRPRTTDRAELWLPLLRSFSNVSSSFVVWKNVESALYGTGDIDAAAKRDDWPVLVGEFRRWAEDAGVGPVVVCEHIPGGINMIAVAPSLDSFLEVGLKERRLWRGATLFHVEDLRSLIYEDARGFRSVRPGAEGAFKLLLNGTRYGGRKNREAIRSKGVVENLRADPAGVEAASPLVGPARGALVRGARAAAAGGWDRPAMLMVESWAVMRAMSDLRMLVRRMYFKLVRTQTCPVVKAILRQGRTIPGDMAEWLDDVATNHAVYGTLAPRAGGPGAADQP